MSQMRIGEVAQETGVRASTIRYYEKIGVLPQPQRVNGRRVYERRVLELLEAIQIGQELGFTLEEIKVLLSSFHSKGESSVRCQEMAQRKIKELDALVVHARQMKEILEEALDCRCTSLQACYIMERH